MTTPYERFVGACNATGPRVLAYVARRTPVRADAADVFADVLTVAWRRVDELPEADDEAAAWLFGIARNVLLNDRRRRDRHDALTDRLAQLLSRPTPSDEEHQSTEALAVRRALERLSPADRELVTLSGWEGLSADEIGAVVGATPGAVRQRLVRARARLRDALAGEGIVAAPAGCARP